MVPFFCMVICSKWKYSVSFSPSSQSLSKSHKSRRNTLKMAIRLNEKIRMQTIPRSIANNCCLLGSNSILGEMRYASYHRSLYTEITACHHLINSISYFILMSKVFIIVLFLLIFILLSLDPGLTRFFSILSIFFCILEIFVKYTNLFNQSASINYVKISIN